MVLSTDMDVHFTLLKRFQDQLGCEPDVRQWDTPELRSLLFQVRAGLCARVPVCGRESGCMESGCMMLGVKGNGGWVFDGLVVAVAGVCDVCGALLQWVEEERKWRLGQGSVVVRQRQRQLCCSIALQCCSCSAVTLSAVCVGIGYKWLPS